MKAFICICFAYLFTACSSVKYVDMKHIRMIGGNASPHKTENSGGIQGKDCSWTILGNSLGSAPSVQGALNSALKNENENLDVMKLFSPSSTSKAMEVNQVQLITNLTVENSGFNFYILGERCVNIQGIGYLSSYL